MRILELYWNESIFNYTSTLVTSTISTSGIIQIRQNTPTSYIEYSTNGSTWVSIGTNWPVQIVNTNGLSTLTVLFTTDLTISNVAIGLGSNGQFIIGSNDITIDDNNKTVLIDGVIGYPGLVKNGTNVSNGKSNITVQNIKSSTLVNYESWICSSHFGRNSTLM